MGGQIHIQPSIQFQVGVNGPDPKLFVRQHLGQAQALHPGEGEVQFFGNPLFKEIQMLVPGDGGDDHVEVMYLPRVHLGQSAGQESRLLLVAALQHHPVPGPDNLLQEGDDLRGGYHLSIGVPLPCVHSFPLGSSLVVPNHLPCLLSLIEAVFPP